MRCLQNIVGLFAIIYTLGLVIYLFQVPSDSFLSEKEIQSFDAIVIFTGEGERIKEAERQILAGFKGNVLISGVYPGVKLHQIMPKIFLPYARKVELDYAAKSTVDNVKLSISWAKYHGFKKLLVITSQYHIPRSKVLLYHYRENIEVDLHPAFPTSIGITSYLREYHKYIVSLFYSHLNYF